MLRKNEEILECTHADIIHNSISARDLSKLSTTRSIRFISYRKRFEDRHLEPWLFFRVNQGTVMEDAVYIGREELRD